uniref:Cytochrome P450 n=1 Tax=Phanerodontia chrysosporium TaxID=2822231 RepID=G5EJW0_PHACH|nr:cytochrome P450 [Phanerodontia chrysosporium]
MLTSQVSIAKLTTLPTSYYALLATVALLALLFARRTQQPTPPGPRGLPIIGNVAELSGGFEWIRFGTTLRKQFGDVLGFKVLNNRILVLNTAKAAKEFMDKRASKYSSRPVLTVIGELMGLDQAMPLIPYGAEWRACRKLEHVALNQSAVKQYRPVIEHHAAQLALDILQEPDKFLTHTRLCTTRIILAVTYGLSARVTATEYISLAEEVMRIVTIYLRPFAHLCDVMPVLKHLPSWIPFRREAEYGRRLFESFVSTPYERTKQAFAKGDAEPSLIRDILASMPQDSLTPEVEHRVKWTAGSMFAAGGESTFGTIGVFMMAMALHPDKQARAQEEVDSAVGTDRLPTMDDKARLPYVYAVVQEAMRWHPMLPLSLPRRAEVDDEYDGYYIAKDTTVCANLWAMGMEPNAKYPPEQFIPERFLDAEHPTPNPNTWAFGFGRRICPGKALAEESLFVLMSTLLAMFKICAPPEGIKPEFESRVVSLPKPFKCIFRLRSPEKADMLRAVVATQ